MERSDPTLPRTGRATSLVVTSLAGLFRGSPIYPEGLSAKARLFTSLTIAAGVLFFLYSLQLTVRSGEYWWIALIFTTIVAGHFTVTLPLKKGAQESVSITMGDVFVFLAILFFGTSVGVVIAVTEGATMNFRASVKHAYKRLFNLSQLSVAAYLVGRVFYWIHGVRPSLDERFSYILPGLLGSIAISAALYFLINTGLVATAMALATGTSPLRMWRENFIWTWIPQSAGTCLAAFTFLWIGDYAYSVLVVAPTVVLIYYAYRSNLQRIKQAQEHLQETRKLLEEKTRVEEALRKSKQGLEDRVNHRTRELTEANRRLTKEIQDRQIAELALAAEKDRLSVTLSSLGEGVIATDREGKITLMNSAAEKLTGWHRIEATRRHLTDVFNLKDQEEEGGSAASKRFSNTGRFLNISNEPVVLRSLNGPEYLISYSEAPNQNGSGVVLVFRDVSDQKRMEEELLQAHKLESVGLLAGGIAHDFNNLLAGILLKSQLVRRALKKQAPVDHHLDSLEEATQRASMLTQQLLTFAKGGEPIKETASIAQLLESSVEFCLRGSNFGCHLEIPEDLWNVEMDKGQISQVIHNLVINAKQAMDAGGTLRVRAENITVLSPKKFPELKPGDYVTVEITDTGTGIKPEHLQRLFEPYFTTKPNGHGLGLAGAYSILKRHGGHIFVASTVGEGSTFTFFLPASVENIGYESQVSNDAANGSGRILVMDDDELLRECACEILIDLGYEVDAVRDGSEACSLYKEAQRSDRAFDAVILDLTIRGGMGGKETIQKLLEIDPDVRAIVASGYSADPIMSDPQKHGFRAVLTKPFLVQAFATALNQVLAETAPRQLRH